MSSRELTYRIVIDTATARREARNIRATFERELRQISLSGFDISKAQAEIKGLRDEVTRLKTEFANIQPPNLASGSNLSGISDFVGGQVDDAVKQLKGLVTGYLGVQGAITAINEAVDLSKLNTQAQRANKSFEILSGGAGKAEVNILAIQQAAGGAVTSLDAIAVGNQAAALSLAKTTEGFADLARAARIITQVSPIIRDQSEALTQLALFSSNAASYARADQLGLSATEVRQRISELRQENDNLDDSQLKLLASMQLLDEKFGSLLNTTEAQASGIERLTTSYGEFRIAMAASSGPVDDMARGLASGFNQATTYIAGTETPLNTLLNNLRETEQIGRAISELNPLKSLLPDEILGMDVNADAIAKDIATSIVQSLNDTNIGAGGLSALGNMFLGKPGEALFGLDTGTILGDPNKIAQVVTALELASSAVAAGVPGAEEYLTKVTEIAVAVDKQNFATAEQVALIGQLTAAYNNAAESGGLMVAQQRQVAEAAKATEEARRTRIYDQEAIINQALAGQAAKAAADPQIGIERAIEAYRKQKAAVEAAIDELVASGISDQGEISIRVAAITESLLQPLIDLEAHANQIDLSTFVDELAQLGDVNVALDNPYIDFLPAMQDYRDELIGLNSEIALSGEISTDQAAQIDAAAAATAFLSDESNLLNAVTKELGTATLANNETIAQTVDAMYMTQIAYANGEISASRYAGIMSGLSGYLLQMAQDAGIATSAILRLNAAQGGFAGMPAFDLGVRQAGAIQDRIQSEEGIRTREAARQAAERAAREQEQAAKRAAREQEAAAKRAGRELEQAAERAARELEGALRKVPGLFSPSQVTDKDMAAAEGGYYTDKADEYLRRLRDEVENGKDWADVSIEEAASAVEAIGVQVANTKEGILSQFEDLWANQALWANESNIDKFVNDEAVQVQLDLIEKAKQGEENLLKRFGVTIDETVAGVTSMGVSVAGTTGLAEAITSGKQTLVDDLTNTVNSAVDSVTGATGPGVTDGGSAAITLVPTLDLVGIQAQIDALTPAPEFSITPRISFGATEASEAALFLQNQIPSPLVWVTLDFATTGAGEGMTAAQALIQKLNTDIRENQPGFAGQGITVAQIIVAGMMAHFKTTQTNAEGQATTSIADALLDKVNGEFSATQNMFYASGLLPAQSVESGFSSYQYTGLANGLLASFTQGIGQRAGDFIERGSIIGGWVLQGMEQPFKTDFGAMLAARAGAAWGDGFMQGVLSAIGGSALVSAITEQVVSDIAWELEQR